MSKDNYINLVREFISQLPKDIDILSVSVARVEDYKNDTVYAQVQVSTEYENFTKDFDVHLTMRLLSDRIEYERGEQAMSFEYDDYLDKQVDENTDDTDREQEYEDYQDHLADKGDDNRDEAKLDD